MARVMMANFLTKSIEMRVLPQTLSRWLGQRASRIGSIRAGEPLRSLSW